VFCGVPIENDILKWHLLKLPKTFKATIPLLSNKDNPMNEFEARFQANAKQAEYWNTKSGPKWVQHDESMNTRFIPLTEELLKQAHPQSSEHVLDIGCGGGSTTKRIAEEVGPSGQVLGIDISEPLLDLARSKCDELTQVRFENADAQVHPLPPKSFDLIFSRFGVMFFSDPYAAFSNLGKSLTSGGRLHFVCWAPIERNSWFTIPLEVAARYLGEADPIPPRTPGPHAFSEPEYVKDFLTQSGFHEIKVSTVETTIISPDSPEQHAAMYLGIGAASRLVLDRSPDPATLQKIIEDLIAEMKLYQTMDGISLGATVNYVSARI